MDNCSLGNTWILLNTRVNNDCYYDDLSKQPGHSGLVLNLFSIKIVLRVKVVSCFNMLLPPIIIIIMQDCSQALNTYGKKIERRA